MHDPGPFDQCRPADVLSAGDVDGLVLRQRSPDAHHAGEMQHGIYAAHRLRHLLRPADVAAVDRDASFLERGRVLIFKHQDAHVVAALVEGRDGVPPQQAVTTGDQYFHVAVSSSRTGDQ